MGVMLTKETEGRPPVGGHPVAVQLRCDHCGEDLRPRTGGTVAWEPDPQAYHLDVVFLHDSCVEGYRGIGETDRHRPIRDPETAEIGSFLAALVHNLEVAG